MSANIDPSFTRQANIGSTLVTAANTSSQGGGTIGTTMFTAFTADATNGSYVDFVRIMPTATSPTAMTATVLRLFACSLATGSPTSANCYLIYEVALGTPNADNATSAAYVQDCPLNFRLPAGWTIQATNHSAPATNTAWRVTTFGGDY